MSDERVYAVSQADGAVLTVDEMAERMVEAQREHHETMAYQHAKDGCPYLDLNLACPYCVDEEPFV